MIPGGATSPFLVTASDGRHWVAKGHRVGAETKHLFNELVAGRLANLLKLAWPEVTVLELSQPCQDAVLDAGLALASVKAVGNLFVPNLRPADWPSELSVGDPQFATKNREYILRLIPSESDRAALYGKNLFDNWVLMKDTSKYDTLQIQQNGQPLFLDASHAFGGDSWKADTPFWEDVAIDAKCPYMEGVLTDTAVHEAWLSRLGELEVDALGQCFDSLPGDWGLDIKRVGKVRRLIASTHSSFVPLFRDWIEWEK